MQVKPPQQARALMSKAKTHMTSYQVTSWSEKHELTVLAPSTNLAA